MKASPDGYSATAIATFSTATPTRSIPPTSAQSQAQRICREQGVSQRSEVYAYSLSQATRVLEWGEPQRARSFARVSVDAQEACLGYALQPQTSVFRTCIDRESYARGLLVNADVRAPVPLN